MGTHEDHVAIFGPTGHAIQTTPGDRSYNMSGVELQEFAWRCQCGAAGEYELYTGRTR